MTTATGWVSRSEQGAPATPEEATDDIMSRKPPQTDMEHKAGLESLDALNAAIIRIASDYGDILNLFRGGGSNGSAADSARKRHRAIIGKQIDADRETKGLPKLSDKNREESANAHPDHIKFCEKLDTDGVQYELVRAQKEALEARRYARIEELRVYGKSFFAGG